MDETKTCKGCRYWKFDKVATHFEGEGKELGNCTNSAQYKKYNSYRTNGIAVYFKAGYVCVHWEAK